MTNIVTDAFTDNSNTALENHPTIGSPGPHASSWNKLPGYGTAGLAVVGNCLVQNGFDNSHVTFYTANCTPADANYSVSADFICLANHSTSVMGVVGRCVDVNTYYLATWNSIHQYWALDSPSATLGTFSDSLTIGNLYSIVLSCNGSTISMSINGTTRITAADTEVTATGLPGVFSFSNSSAVNDLSLDNFSADTLSGSGSSTGDILTAIPRPTAQVAATAAAGTKRAVVTLDDRNGSAKANLSNLKWFWLDSTTPGIGATVTDGATTGTTDSSGVFTVTLTFTSIAIGSVGWLVIHNSTGDPTVAHLAFSGPVTVTLG